MNCTKCNTWNPDDKNFCWRCSAELPKPVEKKQKKQVLFAGLPLWMWFVLGLFMVSLLLGQCVFMGMQPS
jgi:hypothetical protein